MTPSDSPCSPSSRRNSDNDHLPTPSTQENNPRAAFRSRLESFRHTERCPKIESPGRKSTRLLPSSNHASSSSSTTSPMKRTSSSPVKRTPTPKRRRLKRTPSPSRLPPLQDVIVPNLVLLFIGLNPGISTSQTGHAYAHPSNLFWKLLYSSGITPTRLSPTEDRTLPARFLCGNTNICARPTRDGSGLSVKEMSQGAGDLECKINEWRPEAVCLVGKGIWDAVYRVRQGKAQAKSDFHYGWQELRMGVSRDWEGARVFVASSTSGIAAGLRPKEKEDIWRPLGQWVRQRRRQRGFTVEGEIADDASLKVENDHNLA